MTGPADSMPLLLTQVISRTRRSAGGASLDAPDRLDRYAIRHPLVASVSGQTFAVRDDDPAVAGAAAGAAKLFTSRYTEYVGPGIPTLAALAETRQPSVGALPRLHAALRMGDNLLLVFDEPAGQPLDQWLAGAAANAPAIGAQAMVAALARGIASLHGFGFVHGDLRPSGIFVDAASGRIALADWGHTIPTHLSLTESGTVAGHAFDGVAYASAEVLAGGAPRREDDAYAVGCIAYELLTGRHPFDRRSATEAAALGLRPAPIEGLSDRCNALVQSALAARRIDRTVSLSEMAVAFDPPPAPRRAGKVTAAAGAIAGSGSRTAAAALAWVRRPRAGAAPDGQGRGPSDEGVHSPSNAGSRGPANADVRAGSGAGLRKPSDPLARGPARAPVHAASAARRRERLAWGAVATGALALVLAVAGLDASVDRVNAPQPSAVAATPATTVVEPRGVPPVMSPAPAAPEAPPSPEAAAARPAEVASEPAIAPAPTAFERYVRPMPAPGPAPLAAAPVEPATNALERAGAGPTPSRTHVTANAAPADATTRATQPANTARTAQPTPRERAAAARAANARATARAAQRSAFQTTSACPSCDCALLREKRTFTLEPLRVEEQSYLARACRGG